MSATMRTLKLNLLADVTKFGKGLAQASRQTMTFNQKVARYAKIGATAFVGLASAVGIAATRMGIDAVKAAAEDELSQKKLAKALQNTTEATKTQISNTEKWITSQQLAYGIADTKLRPALANLARATKDVGKAQELTTLAMDISAGTGKDLETVSIMLAKAYGGNFTALKKLGIPLDENIIKTKDFDALTNVLIETFGGSASAATDTYAGKLAKLNEATGELKESLGVLLLPIFQRLVDFASSTLIPKLQQVADGFAGKPSSISNKLKQVGSDLGFGPDESGYNLGKSLRKLADSMNYLISVIAGDQSGKAVGNLQRIADALDGLANSIDRVAKAWNNPIFKAGRKITKGLLNPSSLLPDWANGGGKAVGGSVRPGTAYRVGEFGPETFVPTTAGRIVSKGAGGGGGNTFIFNGVIDAESARRSIEKLLRDSSRRTGAVSFVGNHL